MKNLYSTLGFKLVIASMALALVTIGLGGVFVYKVSEDAIKVDAQRTVQQLARDVAAFKVDESPGARNLIDTLTALKVEKFGSAWIMDRNGFLIAHMDPKFRNMVEAQTYIGDTYVNLNVADQPIQQLGEKNVGHKAKLQELFDRFDGGFGTYSFLGDTKIIAFRVIKDRGWLVAVDQPISTAFSELTRIKKVILTTCVVIAVLVFAFTWFAVRIIIRPYYREQEAANLRLETLNQELDQSRRKLEKAGSSMGRLYDLSIAMQYTGFLDTYLPLVLGVAQERFELDRILLMMPDDEGRFLRCRASVGNVFEPEDKIAVPVAPEGGAFYQAFANKRTIFFDGSAPVPPGFRVSPPYDRIRSLRTRAFAIFPLASKDKVLGVLGVDNKMSRRPLSRDDVEAIDGFAFKMASLIDNTIHLRALRKTAQDLENQDSLTGLFHLRHGKTLCDGFIEAAVRDRVPFSAAVVSVSNFREYTEANGYRKGDFVLRKVAELLKGRESAGGVPVRCYGAIFLVLWPGKTAQQAKELMARFEGDVGGVSFSGEKSLRDGKVVCRVNIVEYGRDSGQTFDEFLTSAAPVGS